MEYKGEAVNSLGRDELEGRGAGQEDAAKLKKQMQDLERRFRDQEEEMDDLAGPSALQLVPAQQVDRLPLVLHIQLHGLGGRHLLST